MANTTYDLYVSRIHCVKESSNDQGTPHDEMYFFATAHTPSNGQGGFSSRVYNDIDSGQVWDVNRDGRYYSNGTKIKGTSKHVWQDKPIDKTPGREMMNIYLDMWEEDQGIALSKMDEYFDDMYQRRSELDKALSHDISNNFQGGGNGIGNFGVRHSAGVTLVWKQIGDWITRDVLNLQDDHIGSSCATIVGIDLDAGIFAVQNQGEEYVTNYEFGEEFAITVDGGSEGAYEVFFKFIVNTYGDDSAVVQNAAKKRRDIIERARNLPEDQYKIVFGPFAIDDRKMLFDKIELNWDDKKLEELERAMNEIRQINFAAG